LNVLSDSPTFVAEDRYIIAIEAAGAVEPEPLQDREQPRRSDRNDTRSATLSRLSSQND